MRLTLKTGLIPLRENLFHFFHTRTEIFDGSLEFVAKRKLRTTITPTASTNTKAFEKRRRLTREISQVQKISIFRLPESRDATSRNLRTKPAEQVHQQSGVRVGGRWLTTKRQSGNPVCPLPLVDGGGVGDETAADCAKASLLYAQLFNY